MTHDSLLESGLCSARSAISIELLLTFNPSSRGAKSLVPSQRLISSPPYDYYAPLELVNSLLFRLL